MKKMITFLAVFALAFTLAPAAQAAATVDFTSSTQLNLAGRDVLAAVNFYDPDRFNADTGNRPMTGPLQSVTFDNFRNNVDDTGLSIALSAGAVGSTLSTVIPQDQGREFYSSGLFGTFLPASADNTQAELLANGGAYYQNGEDGQLTFAFAGITTPTAVEVQIIGGGQWNNVGDMDFLVGGVILGNITEADSMNAQIATFEATTDGSGGLVIDLDGNDRYTIISGITVTVAGPSVTPGTLILVK